MSITTQDQALNEVHRLSEQIGRLALRYHSAGAALRADTARQLAAVYRELAAVFDAVPGLYSGRKAAKWLAIAAARDASAMNMTRAQSWAEIAERDQAEADRIARASAAAFADDGTTYVPGRGRLRSARSNG